MGRCDDVDAAKHARAQSLRGVIKLRDHIKRASFRIYHWTHARHRADKHFSRHRIDQHLHRLTGLNGLHIALRHRDTRFQRVEIVDAKQCLPDIDLIA